MSDGTLTPEALAVRAAANGVTLWSLTDHDEIAGQARALQAAQAAGMQYLTGTEISVSFAGKTVHIVGLGFDAHDPRMAQGLLKTRGGREQRAQEMADQLAAVGIPGCFAFCWQPGVDLTHPLCPALGRVRRVQRHP